jgi:CHAT domain-containing protein
MRPVILLALFAAPVAAQAPATVEDRGALLPAAAQDADIAGDGSHSWTVALEAGRAHVVGLDQQGAYLELRWSADGESRRINDRTGRTGREEVFWVAQASGTGTITVVNLTTRPGRYRIELSPPRAATAEDSERHAAERQATLPDVAARRAAADRFRALGLARREVRTLDRMAYLGAARGELEPARRAADECVARARSAGLVEELSSCLCAVAKVAEATGELDRAAESYREAIALREERGDPGPLLSAVADSANLFVLRGEYDEADARRRKALGLARDIGDELAEAVNQMSLGAVASYRGRTEEAVAAFESGRLVARRRGNRQVEAIATMNAGVAYGNLGDIERSIARFEQAIALAEAEGMKPVVAQARMGLGAEHEDAGDLELAERELAAGVALAREIGGPQLLALGEPMLGFVLARRGQAGEAEKHLDAGVAAAREAGSIQDEGTSLLLKGRALTLAGRLDDAEAALTRAGDIFRQCARVDDQGRVALAMAELARARGDLAGAFARTTEALDLFESVRSRVALADQRARYFAFRREAYDLAVAILVERDEREPGQGHLARAFGMTERARVRSLMEELASRRPGPGRVPAELTARHQRALDRIGHLQRELIAVHTSPQPDKAALARLEAEVGEAVSAEEAAEREIRSLVPRAAADPGRADVTELSRRLAPDEAILEYHVAADRSWLFVLTREGLAVSALPGQAALRSQVDELRGLLAQPRTLGASSYASTARRAFDTLLAPAVARRPQLRRLRIVPDGPLWEIPFEALVTEDTRASSYAELSYVLRRYTVAYQPAAADAPDRTRAAGPRLELVAFADPVLPTDDAPPGPVARLERAVFREGDRWRLDRLRCAQQEARDAAAAFGVQAKVHLGGAALESRVKSDPDVARARYLLFATHALLSETLPSQSALVLSLGGDGAEDGLLQVHEIDDLALDADLVVLSACESALGANVRGEGLLGLARAFFQAGARRLVASLWKVADCSAAELSAELFRRLRAPAATDEAEALRRAKLRLLAQPGRAHPYHWAPFVLVG